MSKQDYTIVNVAIRLIRMISLRCPYLFYWYSEETIVVFFYFSFFFVHNFRFQWQTPLLVHQNCTLIATMLHRLRNIVRVQYVWLFRAYFESSLLKNILKAWSDIIKQTNIPTHSKIVRYTANKKICLRTAWRSDDFAVIIKYAYKYYQGRYKHLPWAVILCL